MKKLRVVYCGWGERWLLGTLAQINADILFEYSPQAIARGLQLSPLHHPLPSNGATAGAFRGEAAFYGLPGFIADSLPDGWGMLLMDRALTALNRNPRAVSILDRLAMVGERAIGALAFEPSEDDLLPAEKLQLEELAVAVNALQTDQSAAAADANSFLRHLMQLGGSPQGARPKVLVDFNARTGLFTSGLPLSGSATPWLVKFPAQGEHREVCAIEDLLARAARHGGMAMPRSKLFDLGHKLSAFGVERFDRVVKDKQVTRVPVMSLSGCLQADHRIPAFDLTYSFGPGGEHATSVAGRGIDIERAHLLQVAKVGGITANDAKGRIEHWVASAKTISKLARELPIRRTSLLQVTQHISAQSRTLGS